MSSLPPITQALILVNGLAFLVKPVLAACSRRNIYPDRPLLFLR